MSEETTHTPEPWVILPNEENPDCPKIVTDEGEPWHIAEMIDGFEFVGQEMANARRIVECVNYCQGATTLSGTLHEHEMEMLGRASEAEVFRDEYKARAEAAEKQRDGLLEAAGAVAGDYRARKGRTVHETLIEDLEAAIKAAEK